MVNPNEVEILLVEDNPDDAELTLRALKKHNLANRVKHVIDGAEALAFLFGTDDYQGRDVAAGPRVVLLDLKLPKVDGMEVLRRIKSDPRTKNTPVVILTSSREERRGSSCTTRSSRIWSPTTTGSPRCTSTIRRLRRPWRSSATTRASRGCSPAYRL